MPALSAINSIVVGLFHFYFLYLEMFLWATPAGRKAFNLTAEFATQSRVLAANQGLYNGLLASGCLWAAFHPVAEFATQLRLFFLACVVIAGLYGGATVSPKIYMFQAVPAAVGITLVLLGL